MTATAGYNFKMYVSTTESGTYYELKAKSGSFNRTADVLTVTDTTNVGYNQRIINLLDSACSAEVNWHASDSAQNLVDSALENRTGLWVKILPDGQTGNGKKVPVLVENFNIPLGVSEEIKASVSFQGNGAVIADS